MSSLPQPDKMKKAREDGRVARAMARMAELYKTKDLHVDFLEVDDDLCEEAGLTLKMAEEFGYKTWVPLVLRTCNDLNWNYHRRANHIKFMSGYNERLEDLAAQLGTTTAEQCSTLLTRHVGFIHKLYDSLLDQIIARLGELSVKESITVLQQSMNWITKQQEMQLKLLIAGKGTGAGGMTPEVEMFIEAIKQQGAMAAIMTGLNKESPISIDDYLNESQKRKELLNVIDVGIAADVSKRDADRER